MANTNYVAYAAIANCAVDGTATQIYALGIIGEPTTPIPIATAVGIGLPFLITAGANIGLWTPAVGVAWTQTALNSFDRVTCITAQLSWLACPADFLTAANPVTQFAQDGLAGTTSLLMAWTPAPIYTAANLTVPQYAQQVTATATPIVVTLPKADATTTQTVVVTNGSSGPITVTVTAPDTLTDSGATPIVTPLTIVAGDGSRYTSAVNHWIKT